MFKTLLALAQQTPLALLVSAVGPELRIIVTPCPKDQAAITKLAEQGLMIPLSLQGTPAELETGFANAISEYRESRASLDQQVADTTAVLAAAQKTAGVQGTKALQKSAIKTVAPAKAPTPRAIASVANAGQGDDCDDATGNGEDTDDDTVAAVVVEKTPEPTELSLF